MNRSPEKLRFRSLHSLLLPQFSTYRLRTGFNVKKKQVRMPNYFRIPINFKVFFDKFLKLFVLPKNTCISKNSIKFIIHLKNIYIIEHTYIFTKCNDNFKFSISLKSDEE